MEDLYKVLEVERNASKDDIKKSYRKLSLKYHPDKQVGKTDDEKKQAEEEFKKISEAYSVLSDDSKKQQYDQFGTVGNQQNNQGFDISDMFGFMGNMFNNGQGRQNRTKRGTTLQITLDLTFKEIFNGVKKKIKIKKNVICKECFGKGHEHGGKITKCGHCNGTGVIRKVTNLGHMTSIQDTPCHHCHGTGQTVEKPCKKCDGLGIVEEESIVEFDIPKGIFGSFSLTGQGGAPARGDGINGDIIVNIREVNNDGFRRSPVRPQDLIKDIEISIIDAILGKTIEIELFNGEKIKFNVPPGNQNENVYNLSNKGLPIINSNGYGNLNVVIYNKMPKELTADDKSLLEKLKTSKTFKV